MLHAVAFIVIGLVVGACCIRKTRGVPAVIRLVGGLVGAILGGFISLADLGSKTDSGKYGSLVVALVVAILLGIATAIATNVTPLGRRT